MEKELAKWIGVDEVELTQLAGGSSNLTFRVVSEKGDWVLRRPPMVHVLATANDMKREYTVQTALRDTDVPVARTVAFCDDESVIGAPFYVMEYLDGVVVTTQMPPALDSPEERRRAGEDLVDALAEVHAVDWRACGLEGYGKPTGYLDRQLRRFNGLWEYNKTRELPIIQEVAEWLAENKPESPESTIVHGDYRLGNVMLANDAPARVIAIFDWELSTIGDPLADVGYMTVTWAEQDDPADTSFASLSAVTRQSGFPTREDLIARYEERTGRSVSALNWYQALALWKAAVFMEGNLKRFQAGASDDEYLGLFVEGVPALAEAARQVAHS